MALTPAAAAEVELRQRMPVPASVTPFPVVVIGLGLIGSAAVRHLSEELGASVLGIGPEKPTMAWAAYSGPFASHYDAGRLTRILDLDPVWATLAARSVARYPALEEASGIRFHEPVGSLRVQSLADLHSLQQALEVGQRQGAVLQMIDDCDELQAEFPFFQFQRGAAAIMEYGAAGYVNPTCMVSAQLCLAEKNGACIVREAVREIVPIDNGVRVVTGKGNIFWAGKALVCAGSYSSFLLPHKNTVLDLTTYGRTVLLAEVDAEEEERLKSMPTFIWRLPKNHHHSWVYGCPPIKYSNGRTALKVGGTAWEGLEVGQSEVELEAWFKGNSDTVERRALEDVLLSELMPALRPVSLSWKPCAVSFTAHGHPYIDAVDDDRPATTARVFVAAGGCGAAAKSSDEIGRMAALLVRNGRWDSDLDSNMFRAVFKSKTLI